MSNVSKRVFLRLLHSFVGENNDIKILGIKIPKTAKKIGPNRHFPAKMPKSYNRNISKTVSPTNLKLESQPATMRRYSKIQN